MDKIYLRVDKIEKKYIKYNEKIFSFIEKDEKL